MEDVLNAGIIVLAGIINASLQFGLGGVVLLYHESTSKHVSKRTRSLVSSYLAGMGAITFLALATVTFVISNFYGGALSIEVLIGVVGVLTAMAITVWCFYYRRGTTELWLPRSVTRYIDGRARRTENNTEAYALGMLTAFGEAPFVIILMLIAGNSIAGMDDLWRPVVAGLYTIVAILPVIIVRFVVRQGKNAEAIQQWRLKNRRFLLFVCGAGFVILAGMLFAFKILG